MMHGPTATNFPWRFDLDTRTVRVTVLDTVATKLKPIRQQRWRDARDRAIRLWSMAGLAFTVVEDRPGAHPKYVIDDPRKPRWVWDTYPTAGHMEGDEAQFMRSLIVYRMLRLMTMPEPWIGGVVPGVGWMFDEGAFASFFMEEFWSRDKAAQNYIVCHEMGHALGFSHQLARFGGKPSSVMYEVGGTSSRPDAHDLESLSRYYATG